MDWMKSPGQSDENEAEDLLSYHLHRLMARVQPGRYFENIHASSVTKEGYCPREAALHIELKKAPPVERISTVNEMVWAQGRLVAQHVIDWLIDGGLALSNWRCRSCGATQTLLPKRPEGCPSCHEVRTMHYEEIRFRSQVSGIGGGIDLLVKLPNREKLLMVELKTDDKERFKKLLAPRAEHRERTQLYLRCAAESDSPWRHLVDHNEARVLYISKGGWGEKSSKPSQWGLNDMPWTPFKEYRVTRDDAATEKYVELASPLWKYVQTGTMPAGVCPSAISNRAQNCPVRDACFSGKFTAGCGAK